MIKHYDTQAPSGGGGGEEAIPAGFCKWIAGKIEQLRSMKRTEYGDARYEVFLECREQYEFYAKLTQKKEPVLRWVSVKESLPRKMKTVCVKLSGEGKQIDALHVMHNGRWFDYHDYVTHWLEEIPSSLPDGEVKYFFSQDQDCHWYMIPAEKRKRWNELNNGNPDDEDNDDAINGEFGHHRTGGGIGDIEFSVTTPIN